MTPSKVKEDLYLHLSSLRILNCPRADVVLGVYICISWSVFSSEEVELSSLRYSLTLIL